MSEKERSLHKLSGQQPLGEGKEKIVYPEPGKEDRYVRKVYKKLLDADSTSAIDDLETAEMQGYKYASIERLKQEFYAMKILHFLFPENIPRRSQVTSEPFTTLDERIDGETVKTGLLHFFTNDAQKARSLARELRALGLSVDIEGENFIKKADGTVVYVDDLQKTLQSTLFQKKFEQKLQEAIESKPDSFEKERALKYLARFQTLSAAQ